LLPFGPAARSAIRVHAAGALWPHGVEQLIHVVERVLGAVRNPLDDAVPRLIRRFCRRDSNDERLHGRIIAAPVQVIFKWCSTLGIGARIA
jgi:hypothetical protein